MGDDTASPQVNATAGSQDIFEQRIKALEAKYAELEQKYNKLQQVSAHDVNKADNAAIGKKEDDGKEGGRPRSGSLTTERAKSPSPSKTEEPTGRFRILLNRFDTKTHTYVDFKPEESDHTSKDDEKKYAWQLRKSIEHDDPSELEIFDKPFMALLQKLLAHYPWHWSVSDSYTFFAPYEQIVLNWDLLEKESQEPGTDEVDTLARSDLRSMLETLQQGSGDAKLDEYFKNRNNYRTNRVTNFDALWTIFPPGTLVHARPFMKQDQIFIVYDNNQPWPRISADRYGAAMPWELRCFFYDWDGKRFFRRVVTLSIEHFDGTQPISTLSIKPLELLEDKAEVLKKLIARGKSFREYATLPSEQKMLRYDGRAIFDKSGLRKVFSDVDRDDDATTFQNINPYRAQARQAPVETMPQNVASEVMIDFESYYKYAQPWSSLGKYVIDDEEGECDCTDCRNNEGQLKTWCVGFDNKTGEPTEKWDDLQYIICAPRVLGYILREKIWAQLDVTRLKTVDRDGSDDAFMNRLKLAGQDSGQKTKELLLSLIQNHGITENSDRKDRQLKDLVAEKGRGLVILLYGPPGVGKTSTAQTIAIAAGKPLLTVGVADVGTAARNVERNLEKIFDLATAWKSVLLIDEADVFLQSRTRGELGPTTERNALVSVFLRVLEYYQGILILTTNQIAQFDVAVQSRIHIAIKYESLNVDQTVEIFRNFIKQYEDMGLIEPKEKKQIDHWTKTQLARKKFDGRQIRNIVTSSMGLARSHEDGKLKYDDLLDICDIMEGFKSDLAYQMMQYQESQARKT